MKKTDEVIGSVRGVLEENQVNESHSMVQGLVDEGE
jgi:hypothetical protein